MLSYNHPPALHGIKGYKPLQSRLRLWLALPEGRQFLQRYPRIHALPTQAVEVEARGALLTRFESITHPATLTVIATAATYEVQCILRGGW